MRKIIKLVIGTTLALLFVFCICVSASTVSDDPADYYVKQTAPNEDSSIKLWFDYSFRKTLTSDKISTGMDTFSIYMAKNEIEDGQFVLYSSKDHTGMSAELSTFTDTNGNTVDAEIYYEMYVTVSGIPTTNVVGGSNGNNVIRTGETPDPIAPLSNVGTFKLNGGKSQAFLIRAKTTSDSVSGWYSAQLDIKDSSGNIVKTATVYLYVWDYEIPEEVTLQTAFFIDNNISYGGSYKEFYDYLLENRLCGMDIPGELSPTNPYVTNPRVNSIRITYSGGGNTGTYADQTLTSEYGVLYNKFRKDDDFWEATKDKYYFYSADEPVAALAWTGWTVDKTVGMGIGTQIYWPNAQLVVPHHEDTPYPDRYYTQSLYNYQDYQIKDANQQFIEKGGVTVWCPMIYGLSTNTENRALSNGDGTLRDLSGFISGVYYTPDYSSFYYQVYDWEGLYGDLTDRIKSEVYLQNQAGHDEYKFWAYSCGSGGTHSYCNHVIENSGIQTKLLFWQLYQYDVTGYLYYGTNFWNENNATEASADTTVTGAKTTCKWMVNQNSSCIGDGVLFYGRNQGRVRNVPLIGSLRVELLRDGVEEYEMFEMLEEYLGEAEVKTTLKKISRSVANYVSLPLFNKGSWATGMDDYDAVEYIRRLIGNELEEAVRNGKCDHEWNDGVVTRAAQCIKDGNRTYTCKLCGAEKYEIIPTLHSVGDCYKVYSGFAATCTRAGSIVYQCEICGNKKTVDYSAHHYDSDYYKYVYNNDSGHKLVCKECGTEIGIESHKTLTTSRKATCTSEGYSKTYCRLCEHEDSSEVISVIDHDFVDGYCTMCGKSDGTSSGEPEEPDEPDEPDIMYGDTNGDGKINALDANYLAQIIVGNAPSVEEADISMDGKVNATDSNLLKQIIAGTYIKA